MPLKPLADLGVLVGGVVVEDDVDSLAGGHLRFDQIEKADEFLVAMPLHVAADHGSVEHVERRKERGRPVALIVKMNAHRPFFGIIISAPELSSTQPRCMTRQSTVSKRRLQVFWASKAISRADSRESRTLACCSFKLGHLLAFSFLDQQLEVVPPSWTGLRLS